MTGPAATPDEQESNDSVDEPRAADTYAPADHPAPATDPPGPLSAAAESPAVSEPWPVAGDADGSSDSDRTGTDHLTVGNAPDILEPVIAQEPRRRRVVLPPASPDADRLVAHVLLRTGSALPARVHLETLAGRRQLDERGLLDLAEARWRTGDLGGAGEAVAAYLDSGGKDPLGFLIAAEATAMVGRPGEARKLARRALEDVDQPLDAVFAGQPRSGIWPHDPAAPAQPAGTLFAPQAAEAARGGRIGLTSDARWIPGTSAGSPSTVRPAASQTTPLHAAPETAAELPESPAGPASETQPDHSIWESPGQTPNVELELDAARAALESGDQRSAAVRLAIVLRMSPGLAPVVLDLVGQLPGPDFDLLRGDALRLVGHEAAAERAFAAAADALRQPTPPRSPE